MFQMDMGGSTDKLVARMQMDGARRIGGLDAALP
jgi:hypothetical protein